MAHDHPRARAAGHAEGAEQHDHDEPPADAGDALDDRAPAAGALHGEDQQRDADDGDDDVQGGSASGTLANDVTSYNRSDVNRLTADSTVARPAMAERLVGSNYMTPDIVAKVTGRARYAEDFRADGMLFCKLMLSERPHARVRSIDTSRAHGAARRPRDHHRGRRAAAGRHHRALPHQRAALCGRADSRRGRDRARRSPPKPSS